MRSASNQASTRNLAIAKAVVTSTIRLRYEATIRLRQRIDTLFFIPIAECCSVLQRTRSEIVTSPYRSRIVRVTTA